MRLSPLSGISAALGRAFPAPKFLLPHACGIDISEVSVKWMTLSAGPELHRRVVAWGELPLKPGIVVGGILRDMDALSETLMQIKPRMGGAVSVHASLPEEAAYVFGMHVPERSPRAQVMSMIEFEFDGRVPISPAQALYDHDVIMEHDDGEGEELGVVVFPHEVAEAYAQAFKAAGIELMSFEIEARSIARSVSSSEPTEPITLLVDFGRTRTGFAVLKRGIPIFTSTVEISGTGLISVVQKALSVSLEEAENFCNEQGLVAQSSSSAGTEAVLSTASALCDEIARHYNYWDTRRNDKGERVTPVGTIFLVGGNSNVRGLPEYIAGRVQAPVSLGNVWRHVCDLNEYIPPLDKRVSLQFATAIGLALRGL